MSAANNEENTSGPSSIGLIKLTNPPDVSIEPPKTLVDFSVIGEMLNKYEARNKESFDIN